MPISRQVEGITTVSTRGADDAVEDGRLVPLVDDAHRHEDEPCPEAHGVADELPVDVGLLELSRAGTGGAREGVFDLELQVRSETSR
jgi:hypothetical protein